MATTTTTQPVLALDSASHAVREEEALLDALPYVDPLDPAEAAAAEAAIRQELEASTSSPADYLAAMPPAPDFSLKDHPIAAAELERAATGAAPPPGLDSSRYRLDPPARTADPAAWRAALDNARAQLEHQAGRLLNLELLASHGPRAHAAAAAHTEAAIKAAERETAKLRDEACAVNRARKLAHQKAAAAIDAAEAEWAATVAKCGALEAACAQVEAEVAAKKPAGWGEAKRTGLPALPGEEEEGGGVVAMDE